MASNVMATFLLTGEERTTFSQAVVPHAPFNPPIPFSVPCLGARRRFSHLELGNDGVSPPARAAWPILTRYSREASELTPA